MVRNLAIELAPSKIRINAVAPAVVETPVYNTFMTEEQVKEMLPTFNALIRSAAMASREMWPRRSCSSLRSRRRGSRAPFCRSMAASPQDGNNPMTGAVLAPSLFPDTACRANDVRLVRRNKQRGQDRQAGAEIHELIAFAVAVTARCGGCISVHAKKAVELDVTNGEIAEAISSLMGSLVPQGAGNDPLPVSFGHLVADERSVLGSITGTSYENEKMLDFSVPTGVRLQIETMPLGKTFDAYQKMKSGNVKFRMVLTMKEPARAH